MRRNIELLGLNENIRKFIKSDEIDVCEYNVKELIKSDRLDVVIKYMYASALLTGAETHVYKSIYLDHIEAINGFLEKNEPYKIGKKEYIESFDRMILNFVKDDVCIPVTKDRKILDGAHRLAVALAHGCETIQVVIVDAPSQVYDFQFFKERMKNVNYAELALYKYMTMSSNSIRTAIVWPNVVDKLNVIAKEFGSNKIIFINKYEISEVGIVNLVKYIYHNEMWIGSKVDGFYGVRNKAVNCGFNKQRIFGVIIFEYSNGLDLVDLKERIRSKLGYNKHSIHIVDDCIENIELASVFLSENSRIWLNNALPSDLSDVDAALNNIDQSILKDGLKDKVVFTGGTLCLYGVKPFTDLDYGLLTDLSYALPKPFELEPLKQTDALELLIPKNYMLYRGYRFASLDFVLGKKHEVLSISNGYTLSILPKSLEEPKYRIGAVKKMFYRIAYRSRMLVYWLYRRFR